MKYYGLVLPQGVICLGEFEDKSTALKFAIKENQNTLHEINKEGGVFRVINQEELIALNLSSKNALCLEHKKEKQYFSLTGEGLIVHLPEYSGKKELDVVALDDMENHICIVDSTFLHKWNTSFLGVEFTQQSFSFGWLDDDRELHIFASEDETEFEDKFLDISEENENSIHYWVFADETSLLHFKESLDKSISLAVSNSKGTLSMDVIAYALSNLGHSNPTPKQLNIISSKVWDGIAWEKLQEVIVSTVGRGDVGNNPVVSPSRIVLALAELGYPNGKNEVDAILEVVWSGIDEDELEDLIMETI